MHNQSVRPTDDEIENTVNTYYNMLFKLCFTNLGNIADAEDAVSDTILKYMTKSPPFNDDEHCRAWLIRVAVNTCNSMHRFKKRHDYICIDDCRTLAAQDSDVTVIEEVLKLPEKYKTVLHLHYIEGYKISEIAGILHISLSAVKKRLQYARDRLKLEYGTEACNER